MKKFIIFVLMAAFAVCAKADPLFPFFTDLAGSYENKPTQETQLLKIDCINTSTSPSFKNLKSAESFLKDVLPDGIERSEQTVDKTKIVKYSTKMDPALRGKISEIYLIELPDGRFQIAYNEK